MVIPQQFASNIIIICHLWMGNHPPSQLCWINLNLRSKWRSDPRHIDLFGWNAVLYLDICLLLTLPRLPLIECQTLFQHRIIEGLRDSHFSWRNNVQIQKLPHKISVDKLKSRNQDDAWGRGWGRVSLQAPPRKIYAYPALPSPLPHLILIFGEIYTPCHILGEYIPPRHVAFKLVFVLILGKISSLFSRQDLSQ